MANFAVCHWIHGSLYSTCYVNISILRGQRRVAITVNAALARFWSTGGRINSCLPLAAPHDGDDIITMEGITKGDALHPVQSAFIECDGF